MTTLKFVDAHRPEWSETAFSMTQEYFYWMNDQIQSTCGFSISEVVGMPLDQYIVSAADSICPKDQPHAKFYLLVAEETPVSMGGFRLLPCGDAEVVRIYTKPNHRGRGYGKMMLKRLIADTRLREFKTLKLDTGVFMKDAQSLYASLGFKECAVYDGAEPPARLFPYWHFMALDLQGQTPESASH